MAADGSATHYTQHLATCPSGCGQASWCWTLRTAAQLPGLESTPQACSAPAGILAAGATALTGLSDWTVSNDQDRRVGLFHGLLNTVALGLQGASLGTRMAGHR